MRACGGLRAETATTAHSGAGRCGPARRAITAVPTCGGHREAGAIRRGPRPDPARRLPAEHRGSSRRKLGPPNQFPTFQLFRQRNAEAVNAAIFPCESHSFALDSAAIKNHGGSSPCTRRLSFSHFLPCRSRAACRIPHRAGLPVRPLAPPSPMRWMKTSLPAPRWAAWPVPQPAALRLACRPARPATETAETAACGRIRQQSNHGVARAECPDGPVLPCAPAPGAIEGVPCSRRS
jgi:hypothetical protein